MLFDSPVYLVFLLLVVPLYWALSHRRQNVFLLIASYIFYGWWDWRFLGLILISTVVDFACARAIGSSVSPARRKSLLIFSVGVNLAFLGFFKYFGFFADSLADSLLSVGIEVPRVALNVLLPPGISFYTFQELAYIVDVYNKKLEPAENVVDYALFISLFPHLIAGPIQRPAHLLPQVQAPRHFDTTRVFDGVMLILTGLFRKCVVADNCALIANAAFDGRLGPTSAFTLALGAYAFAWQIYGDFSGYSDMARGSAQLMGFHFMVNFRQPYLSQSIQDFWRRWHISLSTWLRDYLYISLGGNRHGERKTYRNLMTTMLLGGLWHGANWTFVVWGGLQGVMLSVNRWMAGGREVVPPRTEGARSFVSLWGRRIVVFHLVCISWVFFRAMTVSEAWSFLGGITTWTWEPVYGVALLFLAVFALPLFLIDLWLERTGEEYPSERASHRTSILVALVLVASTALFAASETNAFIYFQF